MSIVILYVGDFKRQFCNRLLEKRRVPSSLIANAYFDSVISFLESEPMGKLDPRTSSALQRLLFGDEYLIAATEDWLKNSMEQTLPHIPEGHVAYMERKDGDSIVVVSRSQRTTSLELVEDWEI